VIPTSAESSPIFTSPPTSTATISSDPADFIYLYFENINKRNYNLTWSFLSNQYKTKQNPGGLGDYTKFWDGYNKVDVTSVDVIEHTNTSAIVRLKAVFYTRKGNKASNINTIYYLTWDNPKGIWLFDNPPATVGSASDVTCDTVPKRLSAGIKAQVVTATDPLLLRDNPTENAGVLERINPSTIVTVIGEPTCKLYRSVYFWWWKVQSPSGKVGWVVEGSDAIDPIFILPAP